MNIFLYHLVKSHPALLKCPAFRNVLLLGLLSDIDNALKHISRHWSFFFNCSAVKLPFTIIILFSLEGGSLLYVVFWNPGFQTPILQTPTPQAEVC